VGDAVVFAYLGVVADVEGCAVLQEHGDCCAAKEEISVGGRALYGEWGTALGEARYDVLAVSKPREYQVL